MAFFSPPLFHPLSLSPSPSSSKPQLTHKPYLSLRPRKVPFLISPKVAENGAGAGQTSAAAVEDQNAAQKIPESGPAGPDSTPEKGESSVGSNGSPATMVAKFENPRWVGGTWDVKQFQKDGKTDWDAVIDAEVRRRKWLEDSPQSSSNDDPVVFDTSIIPWWAWVKRFHLPEAELLNGRAAMIGFFMAYFVDGLTGLGLVDQMSNFFCKTLLLVAVVGVLLIRKNEDIETLKKLIEETTFYDKQWQATWKDETLGSFKND